MNGNVSANPTNIDNRTNVLNVAGANRRNSVQNGIQSGVQFLQRAVEEDAGDSDGKSSPLDDLNADEENQDGSDRRTRAEATSIHKVNIPRHVLAISCSDSFHTLQIEDLEITNRSLMVINASLEAAKRRQAKEIQDLRRRLRESRLILPPKAYRLVTSGQVANAFLGTNLDDEDDNNDDDDTDEIGTLDMEKINDEGFKRRRNLLETLLEDGERALATKPEDFEVGPRGTTKVLHAEELRSEVDPDERDRRNDDADTSIMSVDNDSEDEVEGMVSIRITTLMPQSPRPPVLLFIFLLSLPLPIPTFRKPPNTPAFQDLIIVIAVIKFPLHVSYVIAILRTSDSPTPLAVFWRTPTRFTVGSPSQLAVCMSHSVIPTLCPTSQIAQHIYL